MPIFRYRAYDASGKEATGVLEAQGPRDAAERLRKEGLFASEISARLARRGLFCKRVSSAALSSALRQLATLIAAGTPLFEALSVMAGEAENPLLSDALEGARQMVAEGSSLSGAFGAQKVFPEFLVRVVEAGEESGTLEEALVRVAEYLDSKARIKEKVSSAMVYPAVMTAVGAAVLFFLFVFVLPRITRVFDDTQRALPLPTRALFAVVEAVSGYWPLILAAIVVMAWAFMRALRTEKGREAWERAVLRLPLAGGAYRRFQAASFASTLGHLLTTGLPIIKALDLTAKVVSASIYSRAVSRAAVSVAEGSTLAASLRATGLFPAMLIQMVATGERSGELGGLLVKAAGVYEREFDAFIARLLALLEPALVLGMGLVVGFIVLAILLPIFELGQAVG